MKKEAVTELEDIQNDRNVLFCRIRMVKETSDSTGNNCIRNNNGKIVFAENGLKSVEESHENHYE